MPDFPSAEFWVLSMAATERDPLADLAVALAEADTRLPLLDLGAGTGNGTVALADAVPEAYVIAVEPSAPQRIALMMRLASRPDLHSRVSVIPGDLFTVTLPDVWGGMLAHHLLCNSTVHSVVNCCV